MPHAYDILQPFYPLLQSGVWRVQTGIVQLSTQKHDLPFEPEKILKMLLPGLMGKLLQKLSRAVVLEMNIARLCGQLQGEEPQERFQYYLQHLSRREHLQPFLEEYCVLARQLMITIDLWVNCSLEFAQHLCQDWMQIMATFLPEQEPGLLTEIIVGLAIPIGMVIAS